MSYDKFLIFCWKMLARFVSRFYDVAQHLSHLLVYPPNPHLSSLLSLFPPGISMISGNFPVKWTKKAAGNLIFAISFIVFLLLDFFDSVFCIIFRFLDKFLEGNAASTCYCENREEQGRNVSEVGEGEVSETLFGNGRKNIFREMGFVGLWRKSVGDKERGGGIVVNRWSDCGCQSCVSWHKNGDGLHVVVREPSQAIIEESAAKNVIFLHGFISSSSLWTETVFPNLSAHVRQNYRLFAVDLLGFGRSPKPRNCLYTLKDHLEMIEKSVIQDFN